MEAQDSGANTVRLLVKSPNQTLGDHCLDRVHLHWTVRELKERLSRDYPTQPAVNDQRLIYAGKLLLDHLPLKDIFTQTDSVPAIHLVCAFRNTPQEPQVVRPKVAVEEEPQRNMAASAAADLRQRRTTTTSSSSSSPSSPSPAAGTSPTWSPSASPAAAAVVAAERLGAPHIVPPTFPTYSLYSTQQLLWLQHVYARQYFLHYHAAMAATSSTPSTPAATASVSTHYPAVPAPNFVPLPAQIANQNPVANNLPANQNAAQGEVLVEAGDGERNLRMNAQGGPVVDDEDGFQRDWLDWFYSAVQFVTLLSVVYFHSDVSRFLLVMCTILLIYLHSAGMFPFRRAPPQRPDPVQVEQNQNQNLVKSLIERGQSSPPQLLIQKRKP